jgi:hypothetical protein
MTGEIAQPHYFGETPELVWQAAESLYILASCLRQGEDAFGPMAEAAVRSTSLPIALP